MAVLHDFLRTQMLSSQAWYQTSTNKSRTPAPSYRLGDQVFLSTKNIRTARTSRKLVWKRISPFTVKVVISPYPYELDLLSNSQLHPVLHVSLLDPAPVNPVAGQRIPLPPTVVINDN